jgi:hypothetical protein
MAAADRAELRDLVNPKARSLFMAKIVPSALSVLAEKCPVLCYKSMFRL